MACAASTSVAAPAARAKATNSATGVSVPSAFDTAVNAASRVRGPNAARKSVGSTSPAGVMGTTFSTMPRRSRSNCHGTMLA